MGREEPSSLATFGLFRDLTSVEHNILATQISVRSHAAGEIVYESGEPGDELHLLLQGQIQLYRLVMTGQTLVTLSLGPGSFFGEGAMVGASAHTHYARCVHPSVIGRIGRRKFLWLLSAKPAVALRFAEKLAQRNSRLEQRMEALAYKDDSARLATLLLSLAEQTGLGPARVEGLRSQEWGNLVGAYRESVTKTLNEFRANGLIEIGPGHITLVDRPNLELVALLGGGSLAHRAISNAEVRVLLDSEGPAFS
ncbi:MAG: Crp/Fnr family transcriptional regulator [Candidatus Promineifilaceae bacterium]|nr:Crp/Fnr family transcriptional regulator [Candidatus Promineifilaceae bacterium]